MGFRSTIGAASAGLMLVGSVIAAPAPGVTCDGNLSNGTVYVGAHASWDIICAVDYGGGDMASHGVSSFEECIILCDTTAGCIDVSYAPWGMCWLKNVLT